MPTISELKELAVTETPLLLFDCVLGDGTTEHWSTHAVEVDGVEYAARVSRHNAFEIQTAQDQGVDGIPRVALTLANADSHFSQLERQKGFKGAKLTARFVFFDLKAGTAASESAVVFLGLCNPPEEITESTFRLSATNRMSMQRVLLPQVRIQRRCPWSFPETEAQRAEAVEGGAEGKYSRFYRCGYSAGVEGGAGTLNGEGPFTQCGYTKADCQARGMTPRFGGIEFVPSTIQVRTFGDKAWHDSTLSVNEARYNDFVPMTYGTAWITPPVVFARNDGNLTRMEVLLGLGEIEGVVKVLVNDVEIPLGQSGQNMTGTGWYNVPTLGTRAGGFNLDFLNSDGSPAGDPYGSMSYLSLVVPNRLSEGRTLPTVKVLLHGLKVPTYGADGGWLGEAWSDNPAWILLDVLRRSGWSEGEVDLTSFAATAAYCAESIEARDVNGNPIQISRFGCNLTVRKRRSAGDVIRGIRNAARLYLTYGAEGKLELRVENALALQQAAKPTGSNATAPLDGGWPAYEFGDGAEGRSGILRRENGEPAIRLWSRSSADTANRFTVEFQDALNEYQQDGLSLVDGEDVAKAGQEITATLGVLGIPNFDQAGRILRYQLEKSLRGNLYVEFATSVKALGLRPGDLITVTYLKEGLERQLFRVMKIAPGSNFGTATITAQVHDDAWFVDENGEGSGLPGRREGGGGSGLPRPLVGTETDADGEVVFGITEQAAEDAAALEVAFTTPGRVEAGSPGAPQVSLAAEYESGGSLGGDRSYYYAVSGVDAEGAEGPLSFLVRATLPPGSGYKAKLKGLSFAAGTATFRVYRGETPAQLYRIASEQEMAAMFTDTGLEKQVAGPPDANFDHANFYWRRELQPEAAATTHTPDTVGNESLEMVEDRYQGAVVRIMRGPGAGQERRIVGNTTTTLTVTPAWDLAPEAESFFTVAEAGWRLGAATRTSPATFEVPNRFGETIQVSGRAANASDVECSAELSPVTRWRIGGGGEGDSGAPPAPVFGFSESVRGGSVEVRGIGFADLENTRTISSATLTLYWWDELDGATPFSLSAGIGASDEAIALDHAGPGAEGSILQIDGEVMRVEEAFSGGTEYRVSRGAHDSIASGHDAGAKVFHLKKQTMVLPFPKDFFGSPASGSFLHSVRLPNARLVSAEMYAANRFGDGETGSTNLTALTHHGLRTHAGGQYTIQVDGYLAVEESAAPPLVVETKRSVWDVFAVLGRAADAAVVVRLNVDGEEYCEMTVNAHETSSDSADGYSLPVLEAGSKVTLSVRSVGTTEPGADLTVVIRL
jgi:hypothetical protein